MGAVVKKAAGWLGLWIVSAVLYAVLMHWLSGTDEPFGQQLLSGAIFGAVMVAVQIWIHGPGWQSLLGLRPEVDAERNHGEHHERPER